MFFAINYFVVCQQGLKEELNITTQQMAHIETRQEDLDYDIDNLVNLIGTARATGKWEVRNDLFGLIQTTSCWLNWY